MSGVHASLGVAVVVANAAAAAVGGAAWLRREPSSAFWYVLRVAQAAVAVEAGLGVALLVGGADAPGGGLHLFYGISPLVVSVVCEGLRAGVAQAEVEAVEGDVEALDRRQQVLLARRVVLREIGVMTVGSLLILTLTLRAAGIF
ncbi:MAG TPA: hypothetical protein VF520_03820 [Thermoleophilaceae bacterium]